MKAFRLLLAISWTGLWITPDQQGEHLMQQKQYSAAASVFEDPMRQGIAWYRAGEFEKSAQSFGKLSTAPAAYNTGNAWVMLGKYDKAIACYDQALKLQPDWSEAQENRKLAVARAGRIEQKGGDLGDQREGADEIVFDKNKQSEGQETEVAGAQTVSDASIQAMWLRNVQTNPADFLKAKFSYQDSVAEGPKP